MGQQQTLTLDFSKGVNEYFESTTTPEGYATVLHNWVPEPNGVLRVPRGFRSASELNLSGTRTARGIGNYVASDVPQIVVAQAISATQYSLSALNRDSISDGTWGTIETVTANPSSRPVAMAAGAGVLLHCTPEYPNLRIRSWDGSSAGDTSTDAIAGRALIYHANRFFVGGIASEPTVQRWSDLGSATSWTTSTNFQPIGDEDGEPIEDFASWDRSLFIGKESSIWYMTGTGPDNFAWRMLDGGGVAPGRTLIPTPEGLIALGRERVWMLSGSAFEPISRPIENSYGMTGEYMTGAYIDDKVFICDEGSGLVFRFDLQSGAWSMFDVDNTEEGPNMVGATGGYLLAGTQEAASNSVLLYRAEPGEARGLVDNATQTFTASTGELWLSGPSKPYSLLHAHMLVRQRDGDADGAILYVTVYEGDEIKFGPKEVEPTDDLGTHRHDISLGRAGRFFMRIELTQTVAPGQGGLMDVEMVELEYEVDEKR